MTREEILAAGGVPVADEGPKKMTRAEILAAGGKPAGTPQVAPESLTEPEGLSHGQATAGALNAFDSASMIGLPATLAMKDAITGRDSGSEAKSIGPTPGWEKMGFRERYRKNKEFYEGGMQRLSDTNPKSAMAGQVLPALATAAVPGAGAAGAGGKALTALSRMKNIAKGGAMVGGAQGLLRGESATLDGDLAGTATDTLVGAGLGAGGAVVGAGVGKAIEAGGKAAGVAGGKIMGQIRKAANKELDPYIKIRQAGMGADRNMPGDLHRYEEQMGFSKARQPQPVGNPTVAGGKGLNGPDAAREAAWERAYGTKSTTPPPAPPDIDPKAQNNAAWIGGMKNKYNQKAVEKLEQMRALYGDKAHPPLKGMVQNARDAVQKESNAGLKSAVLGGIGGVVGGTAGKWVADKVGLDPSVGYGIGAGVGGLGAAYATRQAAMHVANNPKLIGALMKLKPIGQALAISGGNAGAVGAGRQEPRVRKNAAAILYSLAQKDPAVRDALLSAHEKLPEEQGKTLYQRAYPNGRPPQD